MDLDKEFNKVLSELCDELDNNLYIPLKEELKDCGEHSLGIKKEVFKSIMEQKLIELKNKISDNNG